MHGLAMAKKDLATRVSWPWWSWLALAAVLLTSILTIAATLYDIR
jgi:hypothetical protein